MKRQVKVSIVVPVYNVEKYLEQCMESLLKQTLKDIEIICVNDGSTDGSLEILENFARKDSRVRVITKENSGYGNTMNIGFSNAIGEYIGVVESDDFALPEMFERLYTVAKMYDVEMVKSNYLAYSEEKTEHIENLKGVEYEKVINPLKCQTLFTVPSSSIWSAIYKKRFIDENNITFHETPGASYQDVSFGFLSLLYAKKVVCLKDAYLCYRIDNVNSSVKSREKVFCIMDEFERCEEYAVKEGNVDIIRKTLNYKFTHFMGNYNRVDDLFQYAYVLRMADIFNRNKVQGYFDKKYWSATDWNLMQRLCENPTEFYKETCVAYIDRFVLSKYASNEAIKQNSIIQEVINAKSVIIYGAGKFGIKVLNDIRGKANIKCFAVTSNEKREKELEGLPIYEIKDLVAENKESLVVVAVKKELQLAMLETLKELGFEKIITVDNQANIK